MDCIFCSLFCCDYKQSAEEEMRLHQLLEFQSCRLEIVPRTMLKTIRKFTRGGLLRWKKRKHICKRFQIAVLALLLSVFWGGVHRSANLRAACALIFPFQCKRSSASSSSSGYISSTKSHSSQSRKRQTEMHPKSAGNLQRWAAKINKARPRPKREHTKFRFPFLIPVEMTE